MDYRGAASSKNTVWNTGILYRHEVQKVHPAVHCRVIGGTAAMCGLVKYIEIHNFLTDNCVL